MDKSKRHLRYWIYSKKKSFWHYFGWDQSCCDLWRGDVYISKATDSLWPHPQTWPRPCWKHAAIAVKSSAPNTSPSIYSQWQKKSKRSIVVKRAAKKNYSQHDAALAFRYIERWWRLSKDMLFRVHTAAHIFALSSKEGMKAHSLPASFQITHPLYSSHKWMAGNITPLNLSFRNHWIVLFSTLSS